MATFPAGYGEERTPEQADSGYGIDGYEGGEYARDGYARDGYAMEGSAQDGFLSETGTVEYEAPAYEADPYGVARRPDEVPAELRAFPNEDLGFWIKSIDNSKRVRQDDPGLAEACWRFFSATALVVVVLVGLLAPSAYGVLNGFRLQRLQEHNKALKSDLRRLELKHSTLTSPARLEELARRYDFVDAPRERVIRLRGSESEAVAAWRRIDRGDNR
ncbi:MAG: hypothetical protein R2762_30890 [Bryobacteraceae bacterium]